MSQKMHVIVIGAGCTGLLIAQGLRKHNISCSVYERSPKDRPFRDWSMMLHWGREHIAKTLPEDIAKQFFDECDTDRLTDATSHNEQYHPVYNGKTGGVIVELPYTPVRRYSRAKAVKVLSRGINVHYSKKLVNIEVLPGNTGVHATFEDGTSASGDLVIGADSANSYVRSWLFNHADTAKATELPMIAYNFSTTFPADLAIRIRNLPHLLLVRTVHPDHPTWWTIMNLDIQDLEKPESWRFQMWLTQWTEEPTPETSEGRLKHFKKLGATYSEPFKSAAMAVKDDTAVPKDRLKYWEKPILWDNRNGRVTLAGDAAHPFPPHRGQGLNNGFRDAAGLVDAIVAAYKSGSVDLTAAIASYEAEMSERGKKEIEVSVKQAHAATHFDTFLESPSVKYGPKRVPAGR